MKRYITAKIALSFGVIMVVVLGSLHLAYADATITVVNLDSVGEGFNDPAAPDPDSTAGGNNGETLGEQRLIAFQYAADNWGLILNSNVEIRVGAKFDPLSCGPISAILGSAGPTTVHRDFTGAPEINTWYPQALANSIAGIDLSANDDISATFNSAIGTTCSFPNVWYYGLDGNPPGSKIDFVSVVLHELAHGLGFLTFVSLSSGTKFFGFDDAFMRHLEDHSTGQLYPNMTDAERVAASTDTGDLHWIGPNVVAAGAVLSSGRHPSGHVEMYAPGSQQPGSSVSHFSTSLFPNQLMEPSYTGPTYDVGLAGPLMEDIGWMFAPDLVVSTITVSNDTLTTGQPFTIRATVENTGGGSSDSTTLRYFRSTDATISTADTQLGTDAVTGLSPGGASIESILATAPGTQGIYWIGACVDAISGESSTSNNCSSGVRITVSSFSGLKQLKEEFETWPPEGWSVINNGGTCVWESNSTTGAQNYAQGTGFCADANSDWCGENSTMETELRTPVLDLTEIVRARLSFISSYNNFSENGYAHVDISTNGGDTWENLLKWQEDHYANTQSETVRINLKQYVGYSEVVIRFHYNAPDGFGWWQIDDVVIQSSGRKAMPWIPLLLLNNDNG